MGRVKDESTYKDGEQAVAPSAIAASQNIRRASGKAYPKPRALETDELSGIVNDYVQGAKRAMDAGFDGVEVHAANGYLLDQFLRDGANRREDDYGGSVENRIKFPLEVTKAVADAIGAGRVGIRISPTNPFNDMSDSDPKALFTAFAEKLSDLGLAYLHILEPIKKSHPFRGNDEYLTPFINEAYGGHLMVNGGYGLDDASEALKKHSAELIAFGVPYLANPDLLARYKAGATLNTPDQATFYSGGAEGYTDYPFMKDEVEAA
jgi:N-ethylmaleimide reductase